MKEFDYENLVNNLPDYYAKDETSNNYKLLQIVKKSIDLPKEDISAVSDTLDLNNATGATLDRYGEMLNQPRGLATDAQYRLMIRSKIMQNFSSGDFPSVLRAIYLTFGCEPSEISIIETDTPCTIKISKLPLDVISEAGISLTQTTQIIRRLLPVGIDVDTFSFDGTFALCATEEDMHVDGAIKGLTDTEENMQNPNAVGGTLSAIFDGDTEVLPI